METRPTVFVISKSGHDFSAAEKFGTVRFLTEGPMRRYAITQMQRTMWDVLKDSKPTDFLLCTSLVQMNIVATAIMMYLHGCVNILIHHYKDGESEYIPRHISFTSVCSSSPKGPRVMQDDDEPSNSFP